jgi:uncharacterized membrane protein
MKGLGALIEVVSGVVLLKISPQAINQIAMIFIAQELSEPRHDFILRHLRHMFESLGASGKHFASLYLLSHGAVKLVLVIELLRNKLWAYPLMMLVLTTFVGYQAYRFALTHSVAMVLLTIFDLAIMALTWSEYRRQRESRPAE